ncbi:MAG: ribonuclease III [Bacteroidota bacterium]
MRRLVSSILYRSQKDRKLITAINTIVGSKPFNLRLYELALKHRSIAREGKKGFRESNERLEYLGDAILGAAVADYLFKKFPFKDEGFLTEIRARIVNRESLNDLGRKVGINKIVEYDNSKKKGLSHKSLYGDTLEAIVGAVYLDKGYQFCRRFIIEKLINPYYNIDDLINTNPNQKSKVIEWAQKENKDVRFEILDVKSSKNFKEFTAQVFVNDKPLGKGFGHSKKKAEQDAAQKTCELLNI